MVFFFFFLFFLLVTVEIAITKKTIEVGDDLQLSCKVSGYPIPDVKWYRQVSAIFNVFFRQLNLFSKY